jgi:spermidine synthase
MLFATLTAAACGFVYELVILALGASLVGGSMQQVAVVLGVFVAAMGFGSLMTRPLLRSPVVALVLIECTVAVVGGASAMALYAAFAWLDLYSQAMIVAAALIGALVGAELPLLIVLVQRLRKEAAGRSVADLLAADYAGALVAGIGFPFLLVPLLGHIQTGVAVGMLNVGVGLLVLWLFRRQVRPRVAVGLAVAAVVAIAALATVGLTSSRFETTARQALYDDPIVTSTDTKYQSMVLTRSLGGRDVRLFLNGDLQFSSIDEYRYHEALVHPAMAGPHRSVLVLGGGDGMALREVLRYPGVRRAVEVELDPDVLRLARDNPQLRALNGESLSDPRVEVVEADAFRYLVDTRDRFDVIVADFPDPDDTPVARLYSTEMYGLIKRVLTPGGRLVVQAGSPFFAPHAYWSIERSMRAAGLETRPYHVDVPSFGDWGYHLAQADQPPALRLDAPAGLRFMDREVLQAAAVFPRDRQRLKVDASTLNRPRILTYAAMGWRDE